MSQNQAMWKEKVITLFVGICAIALGYFLIVSINNIFGDKKEDKVDQIAQDVKSIQQSLSPYEYKNTLKKIEIIGGSGFENTATIDNKPTKTYEKNIKINGQLKSGYLYAKVSVDQKSLNKWSDLYVKVQRNVDGKNEEYGGHLITSKSFETPIQKEYSEILFSLNDVKYKERYTSKDIEIISSDWLKLFNENTYDPKIVSFTSTAGQGKIIELSIYYECVDDKDCSIVLNN